MKAQSAKGTRKSCYYKIFSSTTTQKRLTSLSHICEHTFCTDTILHEVRSQWPWPLTVDFYNLFRPSLSASGQFYTYLGNKNRMDGQTTRKQYYSGHGAEALKAVKLHSRIETTRFNYCNSQQFSIKDVFRHFQFEKMEDFPKRSNTANQIWYTIYHTSAWQHPQSQ